MLGMQLLGMHTLSGYVTTSYPYGKGSVIALNTMVSGNFQGLATIDDVGTTHTELVNAAMLFFVVLNGHPTRTSMETARYNIFRMKKRNPQTMVLPQNICEIYAPQHTWAHLQDKSCCGKQRR